MSSSPILVDAEPPDRQPAPKHLTPPAQKPRLFPPTALNSAIRAALGEPLPTSPTAIRTHTSPHTGTRIDYTPTRLALSHAGVLRHLFDFAAPDDGHRVGSPHDQRIECAVLAYARVNLTDPHPWSGSRAQARYPTTAPTPHAPRETFGPFGRAGREPLLRDDGQFVSRDGRASSSHKSSSTTGPSTSSTTNPSSTSSTTNPSSTSPTHPPPIHTHTTIVPALYVFLRGQTLLYTLDHLSAPATSAFPSAGVHAGGLSAGAHASGSSTGGVSSSPTANSSTSASGASPSPSHTASHSSAHSSSGASPSGHSGSSLNNTPSLTPPPALQLSALPVSVRAAWPIFPAGVLVQRALDPEELSSLDPEEVVDVMDPTLREDLVDPTLREDLVDPIVGGDPTAGLGVDRGGAVGGPPNQAQVDEDPTSPDALLPTLFSITAPTAEPGVVARAGRGRIAGLVDGVEHVDGESSKDGLGDDSIGKGGSGDSAEGSASKGPGDHARGTDPTDHARGTNEDEDSPNSTIQEAHTDDSTPHGSPLPALETVVWVSEDAAHPLLLTSYTRRVTSHTRRVRTGDQGGGGSSTGAGAGGSSTTGLAPSNGGPSSSTDAPGSYPTTTPSSSHAAPPSSHERSGNSNTTHLQTTLTLYRYACVPERGGLEVRGVWGVGEGESYDDSPEPDNGIAAENTPATGTGAEGGPGEVAAAPASAGGGEGRPPPTTQDPSAPARPTTRRASAAMKPPSGVSSGGGAAADRPTTRRASSAQAPAPIDKPQTRRASAATKPPSTTKPPPSTTKTPPSTTKTTPPHPPPTDTPLTMAAMMEAAERSKQAPGTASGAASKRRVPSADLAAAVDRLALGGTVGEGGDTNPLSAEDDEDGGGGAPALGPSPSRLPLPPLRHNDRVSAHVWVERVGRIEVGPPPPHAPAAVPGVPDISAALFDVRSEGPTTPPRALVAIASRSRGTVWVMRVGAEVEGGEEGKGAGDGGLKDKEDGDGKGKGARDGKGIKLEREDTPNPFLDPSKAGRHNPFLTAGSSSSLAPGSSSAASTSTSREGSLNPFVDPSNPFLATSRSSSGTPTPLAGSGSATPTPGPVPPRGALPAAGGLAVPPTRSAPKALSAASSVQSAATDVSSKSNVSSKSSKSAQNKGTGKNANKSPKSKKTLLTATLIATLPGISVAPVRATRAGAEGDPPALSYIPNPTAAPQPAPTATQMVPPSAESSFVSMRDGDTTRDRDGDTTIGSSAYASLSANISSSADASSSINADRTIGASSWGTSAGPVPELSLTTAEGDDPNASGSTLHPSSADYNAGPSPAFPEMSAATLPGTAGMALEVPSAGWAVYGGDPSRGVESGTRSRSTSRAGSMLQASAHEPAPARAMEGGDEGRVHDLALVTADGRLRILRGPRQALDVGVVVGGEVYLGGDALDSGTPPDPDAMDVDPPTYGAGPSMHGDSAAAQSTKRLIGVEPDFQGGINLVWATNDLTAPPPPLVLGTRPDDSLFNPVPPSLPGSLSIGPGPTPDAHASLIRAAFGISTTGVSRASASTAAGRTVIANRPARPPTLTRTPLRPRLAPRCALTRRLFHALSLALPADLAWRIYAQWAGKIFGGARGGFPAVSDAEDPAPDSSGLPRTESEFPALCAVFCATLGIPPPSKERADVPARVDAGLPRRASAFHALALSPSASRFREDPALRGLKRPGKVNAMPSVGPVGDAPRGPLQEVSMAEPEEVGPAVLASAMWALHMLFEELTILPSTWIQARRLAPLAVAVASRTRPEWADHYARRCPDDVLQTHEHGDASAPAGWPVADALPIERLPAVAPDVVFCCTGKLGTPGWNMPSYALDAFCSNASREYGAVNPTPSISILRALYERVAGGPRREGLGPGHGLRTLPLKSRPTSPTKAASGTSSPTKRARGRGAGLPAAAGRGRGTSPKKGASNLRARAQTQSQAESPRAMAIREAESPLRPRSQTVTNEGRLQVGGSALQDTSMHDPMVVTKQPRPTAAPMRLDSSDTTAQFRAEETVQFMHAMHLPLAWVDSLPLGIAAPIREALRTVQLAPPATWSLDLWNYVGRNDLAATAGDNIKLLRSDGYLTRKQLLDDRYNRPSIGDIAQEARSAGAGDLHDNKTENKGPQITGVEITNREFTDVRFGSDRRLEDVGRMLASSLIPTIRAVERPDLSETDQVKEQQNLAIRVAERTLALPYGRALFTFATLDSVNRESYQIPKMEYLVRLHPHNLTVSPEPGIVLDSIAWGDFHNGVAAGLRISPKARGIDSSWIAFNRPDELTAEHAGFLFALGLTGHLRELLTWHTFGYLTPKHDLTSIGVLLGLAAANVGTSDSAVTKLLTVHTPALLPTPGVDLNVSLMTQAAGLAGIGVLYMATRNRRMAEVCLSQISRHDLVPPDIHNEHREAYTYSAALAFGMIMLGKGSNVPADMALVQRLNALIHGPDPGITVEGLPPPAGYDLTLTSPAATMALGLMYLRTGRRDIAAILAVPETVRELEHLQPSFLILRTIAKGLILFDDIQPSAEWFNSHLPQPVREGIEARAKRHEPIDDAIELAYYNIISGCCFALALKYAGTAREPAYKIVVKYFDAFTRLVYSQGGGAFEHRIKRSAVRDGLNLISLALAMIMAGTGEITTLRRLRLAYGMLQQSIYHQGFKYGTHMFNHMSLGMLFLGQGRFTLGTSDAAVASMVVAFFPRFNSMSSDNRSYLQALRHLWVLAIEPRCLVARDVDTTEIAYLPIRVQALDSNRSVSNTTLISPTLFPDVEKMVSFRVDTPRYWPVMMDIRRDRRHRENLLKSQTIFVKRRSAFLGYLEDPKGSRSLFVRSGSSSGDAAVLDVPQAIDILTHPAADLSEFITSFSNDVLYIAFADRFCGAESADDAEKMFRTYCHAALLDTLLHEKPQMLQAHLTLYRYRQMGCESSYFILRQQDLRVTADFYGRLYERCMSGRFENNYRHPLLREAEATSALLAIDQRLDVVRRKPAFLDALRHYVLGQRVPRGPDVAASTKELAWYLTRNQVPGTLLSALLKNLMDDALRDFVHQVPTQDELHAMGKGVVHIAQLTGMRMAGMVGTSWPMRSVQDVINLWAGGHA